MRGRSRSRRLLSGLAVLLAGLVVATMSGYADTIQTDGDVASPGNGAVHVGPAGNPCDGSAIVGALAVKYNGSAHYTAGEHVSVTTDPGTSGIAVTSSGATVPSTWDKGVEFTVALSSVVPTSVADGTYQVEITLNGDTSGFAAGSGAGGGKPHITFIVDCVPDPVTTNHAPTVSQAAFDANGVEGDTLSTSGAFTDSDNNPLTITADNTAGTFTDNGDGTWSWSLVTNDDASGTVTVIASDGSLSATDEFTFTAVNANPAVGTVTVTATGPCTVGASAPFTDRGTADTHTASVDFGQGSPVAATITETSGSGTASAGPVTYTTAGPKTVTVTVTDDDGGTGTSAGSTFTPFNIPSNFLAPINTGAGPRSVFKLGSTIPVKITVTNCSGAAVTTLTPTVQLTKVDNVPDGSVNEGGLSEVPTNGKQMRWDGTQYHYNLSTKNSQFSPSGAALTSGSYKLIVTDPTFFAGPVAYFDLR